MAPQMEISTTVYCDHQKNAVLEKRFEGLRVSSFALDLFGLELFLVLVETLRIFWLRIPSDCIETFNFKRTASGDSH